ncbi:MAG: hypothetical protein HY308_04220 [Gammaproteobacteria bacterium]|nr:hypothetical protein [Gammaproteobacteria bacterium]
MADYIVDGTARLDRFLRQQDVQAWRIPILIAHDGVRVFRAGTAVTPISATTALEDGDTVRVVDPPPSSVTTALQQEADNNARDLAFVPGTSAYDRRMQQLMGVRTDTVLFSDTLVDSLRGFVRALGRSDQITHPIRHLLISSHTNPEGLLFMKLDTLGANHITYEDLEAAVRGNTLTIASPLLDPRPNDATTGQPIAAQVLIRGCRIGQAVPYLRKLKEAFGNTLPVVAPKHFHVVAQQSRPAGFAEYMAYGFTQARAAAFRNKAAAVRAFGAAGFTRIDGTPVPARSWGEWIPRRITSTQSLTTRVISPITNRRDATPAEFRVTNRTFLDQPGSVSVTPDPSSYDARKRAVRDDMVANEPRYQSSHAFPEYVRYGHATIDEFMDSWTWSFSYDSSQQLLSYNATRVEYTVLQPIVDPANNELFLNYYPSASSGSVIERLLVTDARFFETV